MASTLETHTVGGVVHIEGTVEWSVQLADGGNYVGICDPLGITLQTPTWASMMEEIGAAQNLLFKELCAGAELEDFLRSHGWKATGELDVGSDFDLPYIPHLVMADQHGSAQTAH